MSYLSSISFDPTVQEAFRNKQMHFTRSFTPGGVPLCTEMNETPEPERPFVVTARIKLVNCVECLKWLHA